MRWSQQQDSPGLHTFSYPLEMVVTVELSSRTPAPPGQSPPAELVVEMKVVDIALCLVEDRVPDSHD